MQEDTGHRCDERCVDGGHHTEWGPGELPPLEGSHEATMRRLQLQERLAAAQGFALDAPLYALGTPVNAIGVDNFRKSRARFEELPRAADGLAPFLARIAGERRRDVAVAVRDLRMLPDGRVTRGGEGSLYLDREGFRGLLARTSCEEPGAAATYLATIPAERRAAEFNAWAGATPPDSKAVLRTRLFAVPDPAADGQLVPVDRTVFAVVSERYGTGLEVDALARAVLAACATTGDGALPGDARVEVVYDGRRATLRVLWHSDIQPASCAAGEVFMAGVTIGAADDGTMSLTGAANLLRNLCLNLIILCDARRELSRRRHVGTRRELEGWLADTLRAGADAVRPFALLWDAASRATLAATVRDVPVGTSDDELVKGTLRGLLKAERVALPGLRREDAVVELHRAWTREPQLTRAGVVNAVTRAAHETPLRGVWSGDEAETAAGALLRNADKAWSWVAAGDRF